MSGGVARSGRESWRRAFGVSAYDDFETLLEDVDAVAFAVPPGIQAELALVAAASGKHLLLDKPVAMTVAAANALRDAAISTGVASVVLRDTGPHALSTLSAVLGPARSLTAVGGDGDVVSMVIRHESGSSSTAVLTLFAPPAAPKAVPGVMRHRSSLPRPSAHPWREDFRGKTHVLLRSTRGVSPHWPRFEEVPDVRHKSAGLEEVTGWSGVESGTAVILLLLLVLTESSSTAVRQRQPGAATLGPRCESSLWAVHLRPKWADRRMPISTCEGGVCRSGAASHEMIKIAETPVDKGDSGAISGRAVSVVGA